MKKILTFTHHFALRVLFSKQLSFGIFFLNLSGTKQARIQLMDRLAHCPERSLGREVWAMLHRNGHDLVRHYESHDLKHVLLEYEQEPEDEIRMQAFMFGNSGFSLFSIVTFLMFVIYTPRVWRELPYHYRIGRNTVPIGHWTLDMYAEYKVDDLRAQINLEQARQTASQQPKTYLSLIDDWMWSLVLRKLHD
jgi:ubiquinone biosynthesis protein Coq4